MEDGGAGDGAAPRKTAPAKPSTRGRRIGGEGPAGQDQALDCPNADEAILDKPATLRCAVAPNLPVAKVFLMYKEPGKEEYTELQMTKTPKGWYVGKIPRRRSPASRSRYYFEGRNAAGKPVVTQRRARRARTSCCLMEEEAYRRGRRRRATPPRWARTSRTRWKSEEGPKKQGSLGRSDKSLEGLDVRFGKRKWWFGIGVGSGFGYAKGDGLEAVNRRPIRISTISRTSSRPVARVPASATSRPSSATDHAEHRRSRWKGGSSTSRSRRSTRASRRGARYRGWRS